MSTASTVSPGKAPSTSTTRPVASRATAAPPAAMAVGTSLSTSPSVGPRHHRRLRPQGRTALVLSALEFLNKDRAVVQWLTTKRRLGLLQPRPR